MTEVISSEIEGSWSIGVEGHHGSMDKKIRLDVEQRLKRGELRCVVSSSSLEMGIDIGSVDMVVQVGSPGSIATALQRVGRAGHQVGVSLELVSYLQVHTIYLSWWLYRMHTYGRMDQLAFLNVVSMW